MQNCVEDRRLHGSARFLIADDVGPGKTLSTAAAALVLSLLDDKSVLILAPATLIWAWQEELEDKLGVPAAVWPTPGARTAVRWRRMDARGVDPVSDRREGLTAERDQPVGLFRNPLPRAAEHPVFRDIRNDAGLASRVVLGPRYDNLSSDIRNDFLGDFEMLAKRHNPIVRRLIRCADAGRARAAEANRHSSNRSTPR